MSGRSIFSRFFAMYLLLISLSIALVAFFSIRILEKVVYQEALIRQTALTRSIGNLFPPQIYKNSQRLEEYCLKAQNDVPIRITVIDDEGNVLADTDHNPELMNNHSDRKEVRHAILYGEGSSIRFSSTLSEELLYTAKYLSSYRVVIRVASSVNNIRRTVVRIYGNIALIGVLTLIVSAFISYISGKRLSKFLDSVVNVASLYAKGDFSRKIHGHLGTIEIRRLSESLNSMALQLREKISTINYQKGELKSMLDNMSEPVILLDYKLLIKDMNPSALALVHLSFKECIGRSIIQIIRNIELCNLAEETLEKGEAQERLLYFEDQNLFLQARINILNGLDDEVAGVLLVLNDVTSIKRLDNMRRDFVANVSHELKTPITSILGYIETLQSGMVKDKDKKDEFLSIIRNQGERLNSIVSELLSLSRLEEEQSSPLEMQNVPVSYLFSSAVSNCRSLADSRNINIQFDCPESLEIFVHPLLVEQTLINLLQNALKYSDDNRTIVFSCSSEESYYIISIQDQGWGIPSADQERVFERFYRVDKARSRSLGGTGLGLAIVKHTMLAHGGYVELESESGKGSCFRLYFPKQG